MYNEAAINNDQPDNDLQCHHIFPDNARCGAPACATSSSATTTTTPPPRRPPHERLARRSTFSLFTPSDFDAIQESLGELLIRIAANDIDPRRAGLLLYCLQISSANLRTKQRAQQTPTGKNRWSHRYDAAASG